MTDDIPSRVAVLEQIARDTQLMLAEIRADIREIRQRQDDNFKFIVRLHFAQFAALVAMTAALLGVMAHGFHWI